MSNPLIKHHAGQKIIRGRLNYVTFSTDKEGLVCLIKVKQFKSPIKSLDKAVCWTLLLSKVISKVIAPEECAKNGIL